MPLIDHPAAFLYAKNYIFRENAVCTASDGGLPSAAAPEECAERGDAEDWFSEPEYGYSAMALRDGAPAPAGCVLTPLREYFAARSAEEGAAAARAKSLLLWRRAVRRCAACGARLKASAVLTAAECPECGRLYFPRIEPCVIVLVSRGDEILLARHRQRNTGIYTCVAGFIEPGESAEQAVVREIKEETNLSVRNVRYCASQGWPFPDQLMLAFRAEYECGEIRVQEEELYEAKWFRRDALPPSPSPGSLAYRLIHGEFDRTV